MRKTSPNWKRTFTLINRLADLISFGVIAGRFGVGTKAAEAWGREPESNENPFGTGRKNPIDGNLRVIALAHKEDEGLAREIAETSVEYCDYLDEQKGKVFAQSGGCAKTLCAQSIKEHTDIVVVLLESDEPDNQRVLTEIAQAQSKLAQLKACVKERAKLEITANVFPIEVNSKQARAS
jgi:hypothetical protein